MFDKKDYTPWILAVVLVVIALMFVWTQASLQAFQPQGEEPRTVDVSGTATIKVAPDKAELYFGYEVELPTAAEAQRDSANVISSVKAALSAAGVEWDSIETSYYTVTPVRRWNEKTEEYEVVAYRAVHMLKVESLELESVGTYADAAVEAGSNRFDSVYFSLSDLKEMEVRNQALYQASQNAREKAQSIAGGLGLNLGRVYSSTESFGYYPYLARSEAAAMPGEDYTPTEITPGEVEVTATVSVRYEIA